MKKKFVIFFEIFCVIFKLTLGEAMEALDLLYSKAYLLGFLVTLIIAVPVINFAIKPTNELTLFATILSLSTIAAPHFVNTFNWLLILPLIWLKIIIALTQSERSKLYYALMPLALAYGILNSVSYTSMLLAVLLFALLMITYKVNPEREQIVNKLVHPAIIFSVIMTLGFANITIYIAYFIKAIIGLLLLKLIYLLITRKVITPDQFYGDIYAFTKFHFIAWYLTMLSINLHVYQIT